MISCDSKRGAAYAETSSACNSSFMKDGVEAAPLNYFNRFDRIKYFKPPQVNFNKLLLGNVFSDIKCDSNYDNDTLCNVLVVRVDSEELETCLQKLEYENADNNT